MQSRDKRVPLDTWHLSETQENFFLGLSTSYVRFFTHTLCRGILHSATPSVTGAVPVQGSTGTLVARGEERIGQVRLAEFFDSGAKTS